MQKTRFDLEIQVALQVGKHWPEVWLGAKEYKNRFDLEIKVAFQVGKHWPEVQHGTKEQKIILLIGNLGETTF